ncbi:MAG: hypothetical protein D4R45_03390 [Planctomycetaceae bacterium]|nr:MAG: hypothetical protein D4R45_03390 [Planctomycetaceae bacterium]
MADYKLNPPHPVEVSKEDLLTVIMELVKVKDLVKWVNTSIPNAPGEFKLHARLNSAIEKIQGCLELMNSFLN